MLDLNIIEKRFRMMGQLILFLGYFYALNKFLINRNIKYFILILFGITVTFLLGFRTLTLALFVVSFVMIIRIYKISFSSLKYLIIYIILLLLLSQTSFVKNIIESMLLRFEYANFDNEEYIRMLQYEYFKESHFINVSDFIFGSGFPNADSSYGRYMYNMQGYNSYGEATGSIAGWFDWGLLGLSWIAGIPTVTILLLISFYMIFKKVPRKYYYYSCTYIFLLLVSITTVEFYRKGAFVFHALAMYSIDYITGKIKK